MWYTYWMIIRNGILMLLFSMPLWSLGKSFRDTLPFPVMQIFQSCIKEMDYRKVDDCQKRLQHLQPLIREWEERYHQHLPFPENGEAETWQRYLEQLIVQDMVDLSRILEDLMGSPKGFRARLRELKGDIELIWATLAKKDFNAYSQVKKSIDHLFQLSRWMESNEDLTGKIKEELATLQSTLRRFL